MDTATAQRGPFHTHMKCALDITPVMAHVSPQTKTALAAAASSLLSWVYLTFV